MAGSRKRGVSLEERLLAIREAAPVETLEPIAAAPVSDPPPAPEPVSAFVDTPEPSTSFSVANPAEAALPRVLARLSATEGDTFLPADGRVDVAGAVQAAARDLWPQTNAPAAPERVDPPAIAEPPFVALPTEALPTEAPQLSSALVDNWFGAPRDAGDRIAYDAAPAHEPVDAIIAEIADPEPFAAGPPFAAPEPFAVPEVVAAPEPFVEAEELITAELVDDHVDDQVDEEVAAEEVVAHEITEIEAVINEITAEADDPTPVIVEAPAPVVLEEVPDPVVIPAAPEFHAAVAEPPFAAVPEPGPDETPWARRVRTERFGRIGTTLIDRGLITNEQLDEALDIQRSSGRRVGDILVELGALSAFELARVLADHMGVPFTDLASKPPDPILATLLPEEVARRYDALAIARWNDQLVIAMANPTDLFALDDLQMVTKQPIIAAMAVKEDLRAAIDRVYRVSIVETTLDAAASDYSSDGGADIGALQAAEVDEGPIVGLVNALMGQAITDHASDLHIEPNSSNIAIRFRIDGVLHDSSVVPLELLRPLVSRVKILAGLDIAQNRLPQDGRFSLTIEGRSVDVRVVTMPTAAGESVIMRLLDPVRDALRVSSLGLSPAEHARFLPAFFASQGAVFIAGPTGSGKTSTVYTVLTEINSRSKSIVSVEDPVEFRLEGVKQMQINARVGLTFPSALPTVLRSDPDVVFIGEVRDTETARIAADASITGHLVLSTLHATRAAAAPMRLVEMGVEPYLVASALTLVASQRLARKLCEHCAEPAEAADLERLRQMGADHEFLEGAMVRRSVGCPACRGTGYRGRLPIFEIMPITEGISRLILDRASRVDIEYLAVDEGMETLRTAALRRVVSGDLSVEEMLRIIS